MTNGELIRKMTDEQLAALFYHIINCCSSPKMDCCVPCPFYETNCHFNGILKWLEKERADER